MIDRVQVHVNLILPQLLPRIYNRHGSNEGTRSIEPVPGDLDTHCPDIPHFYRDLAMMMRKKCAHRSS